MDLVVPGQRLGPAASAASSSSSSTTSSSGLAAGAGCYVHNGSVVASLVGRRLEQNGVVSVVQLAHLASLSPHVGNTVTCRVRSVNPRLAKTDILCIGAVPLRDPFSGIIRVQDVRATEKDTVEIYKSFRPGDIVLAKVISLGDARSYYLSTAENELGVVSAKSVAGAPLIPVSWIEMQCSATGAKEYRKVAKVVQTATTSS